MTRVLLRTLAAAVLLVASVLIGWRVLGPAEVLGSATSPYPPLTIRTPGVTGRTNVAPLVVDGRLRVYAAKHQVRADGPVDGRTVYTARWSLRRWPEQLSAVTASGTTVVTRWSDGELVAIDARTGEIAWRVSAAASAPDYAGHRTGAATVWDARALRIAAGTVVVTEDQELLGYAVSTGEVSWRLPRPTGCAETFTTSSAVFACSVAYDATTGKAVTGLPAGPWTPVGCEPDGSACAGLRDAAGQGWIDGKRAPALDDPEATVAAGVVVSSAGAVVTGRSAAGAVLWTWNGSARVLGGSDATVLLLTPENTLVGVDAGTGVETLRFPLAFGTESTEWKPGRYRIAGGYLAMERLNVDAPEDDPESPIYYLTLDTVIIAAL
ncbi:outer membrane protein assembly factor BamB [Actinoplanes lutulentus]|uniref:Putative pyrroloquinoline-quinone binding quinoprotein n=1 Tax=Actinoplanes lutulentus TaxID=1287878 RepID=A0A327ZBJ4_9ACTN|nr:PQQ-binding-like beta-propeller repeat protein [Actinoplanes lutulentus]MBB2945747.1 outer membrane protein assembly factor BamB [Actinoplanes lutulentus]RAK37796.1 putative pyrroloquinoline-quinone binding quinoprotein [Actinoplanes lutulentus]